MVCAGATPVILVGKFAPLEPPSPQRPASLLSKKPNTEKSPCVIVAFAAEVHSVTIPAHAATKTFRQHTPRPTPVLLFTICSPKPTRFSDVSYALTNKLVVQKHLLPVH